MSMLYCIAIKLLVVTRVRTVKALTLIERQVMVTSYELPKLIVARAEERCHVTRIQVMFD
jgi:hypothetical protein